MKVTLLTHTPEPEKVIACAAKLCYSSKVDIDSLMDSLTPESTEKFVRKLVSLGHQSPLEHVSFTFALEGVSRSFLAQITRHRVASFSVRSQRYCNEGEFEAVAPIKIKNNKEANEKFETIMNNLHEEYNNLQTEFGLSNEDARAILPNACATRMIVTMNVRELWHFFNERLCCFDEDTEVLTNQGWKKFKNLDTTEKFYSLNPNNHKVELVEAQDYIVEPFKGDLVRTKSQSIDLLTTDNHNLYVSTSYDNKNWKLLQAKDCVDKKRILMKKNSKPIEGMKENKFVLPAILVEDANQFTTWEKTIPERKIPIIPFLQFLGMYLSDGYVTKSGHHYYVGISKGDWNKIEKYKAILEQLTPNKVKIIQDKRNINGSWKIQVHDRQLFEWARKLGRTKTKYIPNDLFKLDASLLKYLWEGLMDGDTNKEHTCYTTISRQLANDIQRLALHIGISATVTPYDRIGHVSKTKMSNGKIHTIVTKNVCYSVSINRKKNEPIIKATNRVPFSLEKYTGKVYCVNLKKNHILYVRRNGKSVWCGNCRAQHEIRMVANEMLKKCREVAPILFETSGAKCDSLGYCPEGSMCCGKAPTIETVMEVYNKHVGE